MPLQLRVAEQYLAAFGNIAKQGTTMLLPSSASEPAAMVAQALSIYKSMGVGGGLPGGAGGVQQEHTELSSHAGTVAAEPHAPAVPKLASADEALRSMLRETIDEREAHEGRARFSLQR